MSIRIAARHRGWQCVPASKTDRCNRQRLPILLAGADPSSHQDSLFCEPLQSGGYSLTPSCGIRCGAVLFRLWDPET
ncbi:MAG: hypothetical protein NVS3B6_21010 [Pseudarthrobacter sp.]